MTLEKPAAAACLACVLLSVVVFLDRGANIWRASQVAPGTTNTTGFEEESYFALWRFVHHQPVYVESTRLPFASAYFNWLFYVGYGAPLRVLVGESDESIPRLARLLTAMGAIAGAGIFCALLRRVLPGAAAFAAAIAAFAFFGPLVGYWAHSVRPDVWGLALETAGVAALLSWHRRHPVRAGVAATACFYGAWACKQTFILGLGAALLFLLRERRFRFALLMAATTVALWGATLLALGPTYRAIQQATATTNLYFFAGGLILARDALLLKSAPLLVLAVALGWPARAPAPATASLAADARRFGIIGFIVATLLACVGSSKMGASTNYFFTSALMLALAGAGDYALRPRAIVPLAFGTLAVALQLAVLAGRAGTLQLDDQTRSLGERWAVFRALPEPRFAADNQLELPWLNPHSPACVLAYNYDLDRRAGRPFEAGGIGGLIDSGYFAALLLPSDTGGSFLGGGLARYERGATVGRFAVYRRRD